MSNQSVQPVQIKSPANHVGLYHTAYNQVHNQVHSGFATVNAVQKKEKASISSIFNWKKDKIRTSEQTPTLCTSSYQPAAYPIQYATSNYNSNYIIDSNRKFVHYNSVYKPNGYVPQPFPSTIHATIRYLPNHKQRTNILTTNWEPAAISTYPHASATGQPITFQHEITYSEQITIAPSPCHLTHHCLTNASSCLTKNQSCKCHPNEKANYFLIPTNSSLLDSSTKLHNKSTDCMLRNGTKGPPNKHSSSSIRGSKSHHNLNIEQLESNGTLVSKKKGTKLAATVNERFLRIFKKSIREPFSTKKSRKSILDCDLTAYDLVEENDSKENIIEDVNGKSDMQTTTANLDSSLEEEDEDRFANNFILAKAKQKQHYYSPFDDQQVNEDRNCAEDKNQKAKNYKMLNRKDAITKTNDKDEEDRWTNGRSPFTPTARVQNASTKRATKFNSCRIAGQGMQFSKRMSILESDLSKEFLKEELSEDEDQNRFDRYAHNFDQLDKTERLNSKLNKLNDLNNFRMFSSSVRSHMMFPGKSIKC